MNERRTSDDDELAFLATYDASRFPRPSVAVDVVLLTVRDGAVWALLGRRDEHPHRGRWALPGTFLGIDESPDDAAVRVLASKAGLGGVFTEQLYTFGAPDRDPRTRVVSVAYYALVEPATLERAVASHANGLILARLDVPWPGETGGPVAALDRDGAPFLLAFDHAEILGMAVKRIRGKLDYAPIGFELLPRAFSLRDLRLVHEAILGRALNKDSFRRRILDRGLVVATGERAAGVGHRPPELYRFSDRSAT
ncbi:MAG TPA: NUDIX domain-containing protein [Candidatus Limnocylindrales bacterium]|nr:NUDIX domain-containing protein [Candidatus Limnocylindrales bacterium]